MSRPSPGRSRVLVIGLDSADADLVERWCAEGDLPNLAALRREGLWSRLRTTAEVLHVSAWPTMYTGATPGHHGMYHAFQIRAGEGAIHRTRAEECALPPFWKFLDDAGRKCLVMDAFMDYRLDGFGGIQVLEYGTWTWFTRPGSTPSGVRGEIKRRFGPYPAPEHTKVLTVPDVAGFRDQLVAGAALKGRVIEWLLREKPWDMAFVTFGEPHGGGHYLWHASDPEYPVHPGAGASGAGHALRDVYAAVDRAIGGIVSTVDDSTTILVVSGDGMGPNYSGCHHLPEVLHRLGLFHGTGVGSDPGGGRGEALSRSRPGLVASLRDAVPLSLRHAVTRCLPQNLHYWLNVKWANQAIDWKRSKALCIPNSNEGYVRVNLQGREPGGLVSPGTAYQELVDTVEAAVSELVVPGGRRAAGHVFQMDGLFQGPRRMDLPDLVVTWDLDARILGDLESDRCGLIRGPAGHQVAPYYTGNHRPVAFVIGRGPHVSAGSALEGHIVDLPATVLALLGVDPPPHFEGSAWRPFLAR